MKAQNIDEILSAYEQAVVESEKNPSDPVLKEKVLTLKKKAYVAASLFKGALWYKVEQRGLSA